MTTQTEANVEFTHHEKFWLNITAVINAAIIATIFVMLTFKVIDDPSTFRSNTVFFTAAYAVMATVCSIVSAQGMLETKSHHPDHDTIGATPLFILRAGATIWPIAWLIVLAGYAYLAATDE